jgi:hypothetical protein
VQGGVKLYRQTFLSPVYEDKHPDEKDQIEALRAQILEYASVIDQALDLHGQVCRDTAFHEALKSRTLFVCEKRAMLIYRLPSCLSGRDRFLVAIDPEAIWTTSSAQA